MDNDEVGARIGFAKTLARKVISNISAPFPPVLIRDVVAYIKQDANLKVFSWNFTKKISGLLVNDGENSSIGYNINQHRHRQRFTVAHEIGHCLLGHTCSSADYNFGSKNPHEVEANQFAAELLMPLEKLKEDCRIGIDAPELAKKYYVSEESMWWRLMDCKLIK